eukprot:CAMPEP_0205829620 /NCGR_PEP_ID=MMETSP0206-20130828/38707_1 /ASSEMBLY_ACC=CAM_ASM_000279 /TAXON_ID=36767 /ORGANISM="Euplotes focardii, Strain TN1" /LENGTH=84 /DNA_ID=CAMNT_0053132503 /DNA_START=36 /DNA_END=286 /DNA_ORIENTATION=-
MRGYVREKPMQEKLIHVLGTRYRYRPGGYTRVVRSHQRYGDNAPMAFIEFVDRPEELRMARPCGPEFLAKGLHPLRVGKRAELL